MKEHVQIQIFSQIDFFNFFLYVVNWEQKFADLHQKYDLVQKELIETQSNKTILKAQIKKIEEEYNIHAIHPIHTGISFH